MSATSSRRSPGVRRRTSGSPARAATASLVGPRGGSPVRDAPLTRVRRFPSTINHHPCWDSADHVLSDHDRVPCSCQSQQANVLSRSQIHQVARTHIPTPATELLSRSREMLPCGLADAVGRLDCPYRKEFEGRPAYALDGRACDMHAYVEPPAVVELPPRVQHGRPGHVASQTVYLQGNRSVASRHAFTAVRPDLDIFQARVDQTVCPASALPRSVSGWKDSPDPGKRYQRSVSCQREAARPPRWGWNASPGYWGQMNDRIHPRTLGQSSASA